MKFNVGDKIKMKRQYPFSLLKHRDAVGQIVELRRYTRRWADKSYTHYLVKWDCYKIPHAYGIWMVDEYCELINQH